MENEEFCEWTYRKWNPSSRVTATWKMINDIFCDIAVNYFTIWINWRERRWNGVMNGSSFLSSAYMIITQQPVSPSSFCDSGDSNGVTNWSPGDTNSSFLVCVMMKLVKQEWKIFKYIEFKSSYPSILSESLNCLQKIPMTCY